MITIAIRIFTMVNMGLLQLRPLLIIAQKSYSYDDGSYLLYTFDNRFRLISVFNNKTSKFSDDPVDISAVKRDIFRVVQPVIDAQSAPLFNLQWIYDWVNKDRFN